MKIVWAILSDYVIVDRDTGKQSLIGIFSHINVPQLPSGPVALWLTVQVEFEPVEPEETIHVQCDLIDEDGRLVHQVNLTVMPPPIHPGDMHIRPIMPMFVGNVVFEAEGMHRIDFHIGGQQLLEVPLWVTTGPPPPIPGEDLGTVGGE